MMSKAIGQIGQSYSMYVNQLRPRCSSVTARTGDAAEAAAGKNTWTDDDGDTVELSSQMRATEKQGKNVADDPGSRASLRGLEYDGAAAKRQRRSIEDSGKLMEVFRRIASGAKVPVADQKKLMDASPGMYQTAKLAAQMAENDDEYESLWKNEDRRKSHDLRHAAHSTEQSVSRPQEAPPAAAAGADVQV